MPEAPVVKIAPKRSHWTERAARKVDRKRKKEEMCRQRQVEDAAWGRRRTELVLDRYHWTANKVWVLRENMKDRVPVVLNFYEGDPNKPQSLQQLVESMDLSPTWRGLYFLRGKADNIDVEVLDQAARMLLTTPARLLTEDFDPGHSPIMPDNTTGLVDTLAENLQWFVAVYDDRVALCKQLQKCLRTRRVSGKVDKTAFHSAFEIWNRLPKIVVSEGPDLLDILGRQSDDPPQFDAEAVEKVRQFLFIYQLYQGELHRQLRRRLRLKLQRTVRLRTLLDLAFVVGVEPESILDGTVFG